MKLLPCDAGVRGHHVAAIWWDLTIQRPTANAPKCRSRGFMLRFIGASNHRHVRAVHRLPSFDLVDFAYIVLSALAMAALGININFSAIAKRLKESVQQASSRPCCSVCFMAESALVFPNIIVYCAACRLRRRLWISDSRIAHRKSATA